MLLQAIKPSCRQARCVLARACAGLHAVLMHGCWRQMSTLPAGCLEVYEERFLVDACMLCTCCRLQFTKEQREQGPLNSYTQQPSTRQGDLGILADPVLCHMLFLPNSARNLCLCCEEDTALKHYGTHTSIRNSMVRSTF